MYLQSIQIRNYRGFKNFDLPLHPDITVLIGNNGMGKSALLDALKISIGSWFLGLKNTKETAPTIHKRDAHRKLFGEDSYPTFEVIYPVEVQAKGNIFGEEMEWSRSLNSERGRTTHAGASSLKTFAQELEEKSHEHPDVEFPLLAYYGTQRIQHQKAASPTKQVFPASRLKGYEHSLNDSKNINDLTSWFKWRVSSEVQSEVQSAAKTDEERMGPASAAAIAAALAGLAGASVGGAVIAAFLGGMYVSNSAEKGKEKVENLPVQEKLQNSPIVIVAEIIQGCIPGCRSFHYDFGRDELLLGTDKGETIPFHLLSDGYRNFVGMVGDIAWRALQLNPHYGKDAATRIKGVVLIDEIELHLHPSWQRSVLSNLHSAFPNIQFIVTTHSPQILSSTKAEWIRVLKHKEEKPFCLENLYGKDSNTILEDIMDTPLRQQDMQDKLEKVAALLEENWEEAEKYLRDEIIPHLGQNDTEVTRILWEIDFAKGASNQ